VEAAAISASEGHSAAPDRGKNRRQLGEASGLPPPNLEKGVLKDVAGILLATGLLPGK
jgi:hypothetical protein